MHCITDDDRTDLHLYIHIYFFGGGEHGSGLNTFLQICF